MYPVTAGFVLVLGLIGLVSGDARAQQEQECANSVEGVDQMKERFRLLFSDPAFQAARDHHSLSTLPDSAQASVFLTKAATCRSLVRDAADALNTEYGNQVDWRSMEYVVIAIGPYALLVDQGWEGDVQPVVIFDRDTSALVTVILIGW